MWTLAAHLCHNGAMRRVRLVLLLSVLLVVSTLTIAVLAQDSGDWSTFAPFIAKPEPAELTVCTLGDADGRLSTSGDRSPLAGWQLTLIVNGHSQNPARTTGGNGCATWSGLDPTKEYAALEALPAGWTALNGPRQDFGQLGAGQSYQFTFINTQQMVEVRAMWVTRYDWTTATGASPDRIDEIVANAAAAGFNTIYFQVRGEGDAYYQSNYEPWSQRLSGTLGQNPGWDPLARMIGLAHAQGIQVHAYINTYPVWLGCTPPSAAVSPQHVFYRLLAAHGGSLERPNGLQWNSSYQIICGSLARPDYMRASPASIAGDDHLLALAKDIVTRYDVDGLHLDHIRYAAGASCDPVSICRYVYGRDSCSPNPVPACPLGSAQYADWQRAQVNGTVRKFYEQIVPLKPRLWLSAAVWPTYVDYWGWGFSEGYDDYYQDSKAWIQNAYIDSISPMIYSGDPDTFPTWRWQALVADFQADRAGRYIVPGIGGAAFYSFSELEARINLARQLGTAGHAIFSYGQLNQRGYFDDLRAGPYARPAIVPEIPWHS